LYHQLHNQINLCHKQTSNSLACALLLQSLLHDSWWANWNLKYGKTNVCIASRLLLCLLVHERGNCKCYNHTSIKPQYFYVWNTLCSYKEMLYCEIIYFHWTFNFVYLVGRAIHEFKIPTKLLFTLDLLHLVWNPQIQVSTNVSNVVKPQNFVPTKLNDFTVFIMKLQNHLYEFICISLQGYARSSRDIRSNEHAIHEICILQPLVTELWSRLHALNVRMFNILLHLCWHKIEFFGPWQNDIFQLFSFASTMWNKNTKAWQNNMVLALFG